MVLCASVPTANDDGSAGSVPVSVARDSTLAGWPSTVHNWLSASVGLTVCMEGSTTSATGDGIAGLRKEGAPITVPHRR